MLLIYYFPKLCRSVLDFFLICPVSSLLLLFWVRKVGLPSTVVTQGLVSPPFSNSWALIFLTGVAPPEPVDLEPVERDLEYGERWVVVVGEVVSGAWWCCGYLLWGEEEPDWPGGRLWATSQLSIMCRLAFLMR